MRQRRTAGRDGCGTGVLFVSEPGARGGAGERTRTEPCATHAVLHCRHVPGPWAHLHHTTRLLRARGRAAWCAQGWGDNAQLATPATCGAGRSSYMGRCGRSKTMLGRAHVGWGCGERSITKRVLDSSWHWSISPMDDCGCWMIARSVLGPSASWNDQSTTWPARHTATRRQARHVSARSAHQHQPHDGATSTGRGIGTGGPTPRTTGRANVSDTRGHGWVGVA